MTSFFDQLDKQLREIANRKPGPAARSRRAPRHTRKLSVILLAVLAVSGTALAATGLWRPILGEPRFGPPPTITSSAPPRSQLELLGVLRRPQTRADRGAATLEELQYLSRTASGVRTGYIRLLSDHTGLGAAVLVPAARYSLSADEAPPSVVTSAPRKNALCLVVGDRDGQGSAKGCFTTDDVRDGAATLSLGRYLFGLVPDGVRTVTVTFGDKRTATSPASSNLFEIPMPAGALPQYMTWTTTTGASQRFPI
jgi:hypothetical protein